MHIEYNCPWCNGNIRAQTLKREEGVYESGTCHICKKPFIAYFVGGRVIVFAGVFTKVVV